MSNSNTLLSRTNSLQELTRRSSNLFNSSLESSTNSSDSKSSHYITESGNNRLSLHDSLDHELDDDIFESRAVLDHYCPVERADVDGVLNWLETQYGVKHDCILDSCSLGDDFSPLEGGSVPLANVFSWILSRIILACTAKIGARVGRKNSMDHMQFTVQEATPEVGKKAYSMVLGTINIQRSEEIDWRDAPFCLLLHHNWSLLHSHGTVYARNRFTNAKNREWVPVVFVASDNNNVEVRIGIFTRSGLFTTEPLDFLSAMPAKPCDWKEEYRPAITKEQAFRKFVRGIIGIYNAEYTKVGIDITRHPTSPHIFLPPPLGLGVIKEVHCERQCVKGRATRVYRVQQEDPEDHTAVLEDLGEGFRANSSVPIKFQERQQATPDYEPLLTTNLSPNWVVVIKDCWSCASENNELEIFRTLNGCFGLPILLYGYSVTNAETRFPQTEDAAIIPHDARIWKPIPGGMKMPKPLQRLHERMIFKTLGRSILTARSPRELVRAIAHAILGHYTMFKRGWLHCDVSIGNVLIMDPIETRSPVTDFEFSKSVSRCEGFLTDGDQAVCRADDGEYKWTVSGRPKGTPMFMSQKLIKAWNSGRWVTHTPIDDLESFVWVLVWAIFDILKSRRISLHPVEETFITFMSSRNLSSILCRMDVGEFVQRPDTDASPGFRPFIPLLRDWFRIVSSADQKRESLALSQSQEEYTSVCKDVYEEYLKAAFDRLEDLPQMWETDESVPIEEP